MTELITKTEQVGLRNVAVRISQKRDICLKFMSIGSASTNADIINIEDKALSNLSGAQGLVAHEAGHIGYGSFSESINSMMNDRLHDIYRLNTNLAHYLLNVVEDARINLINKRIFPGFHKSLMEYSKKWVDDLIAAPEVTVNDLRSKFLVEVCYYLQDQFIPDFSKYARIGMNNDDFATINKVRKHIHKNYTCLSSILGAEMLAPIIKKLYEDSGSENPIGDMQGSSEHKEGKKSNAQRYLDDKVRDMIEKLNKKDAKKELDRAIAKKAAEEEESKEEESKEEESKEESDDTEESEEQEGEKDESEKESDDTEESEESEESEKESEESEEEDGKSDDSIEEPEVYEAEEGIEEESEGSEESEEQEGDFEGKGSSGDDEEGKEGSEEEVEGSEDESEEFDDSEESGESEGETSEKTDEDNESGESEGEDGSEGSEGSEGDSEGDSEESDESNGSEEGSEVSEGSEGGSEGSEEGSEVSEGSEGGSEGSEGDYERDSDGLEGEIIGERKGYDDGSDTVHTDDEVEDSYDDKLRDEIGHIVSDVKKMTDDKLEKIQSEGIKTEIQMRNVTEEKIDARNMYLEGDKYSDIVKAYRKTISKIRSYFEEMKVESGMVKHQKTGRINNTLVRAIVADKDDCFSRRVIEILPKITLMIDISGSMSGSKMCIAKDAMVCFLESLKDIADLRVVLFCGGYDAINIVIKDFEKELDPKNIDAFGCRNRNEQNIDGQSVLFEAEKLKDENNSMIIVVSDGQPAGSSYDISCAIPEFIEARKKVELFAFTFDAYADYLEYLYGKGRYIECSTDQEEMIGKIIRFTRMVVSRLLTK